MKKILISLLLISYSIVSWSQNDQSPKTDEIQKSMEEAMQEFQLSLDSFDMSSFFSQDLSKMLGDSTMMKSFDLGQMGEMLGGMDMNELFGPEMQKQMEESMKMLEGMDMSELNSLFEGIDMSQLEGMFEGIDMSEMQKMFEGFEMPEIKEIEPIEKKSKDSKKI